MGKKKNRNRHPVSKLAFLLTNRRKVRISYGHLASQVILSSCGVTLIARFNFSMVCTLLYDIIGLLRYKRVAELHGGGHLVLR